MICTILAVVLVTLVTMQQPTHFGYGMSLRGKTYPQKTLWSGDTNGYGYGYDDRDEDDDDDGSSAVMTPPPNVPTPSLNGGGGIAQVYCAYCLRYGFQQCINTWCYGGFAVAQPLSVQPITYS